MPSGYELSKDWFDFSFENPELINPTHTALYFFAIEHCNRLGWKEKFGMPTQMAMDAIGVKNWRTYSKAFNDLVEWGFFKLIEKSKNQYSATVIAIVKNTRANTKALTKARQKHVQKQSSSIAVIDKPINSITPKQDIPAFDEFKTYALSKEKTLDVSNLKLKYEAWIENGWKDGNNKPIIKWKAKLLNTIPHLKAIRSNGEHRPTKTLPKF